MLGAIVGHGEYRGPVGATTAPPTPPTLAPLPDCEQRTASSQRRRRGGERAGLGHPEGLRSALADAGLPGHVSGLGSMFNLAISAEPVTSYRAELVEPGSRGAAFDPQVLGHTPWTVVATVRCGTTAFSKSSDAPDTPQRGAVQCAVPAVVLLDPHQDVSARASLRQYLRIR